MRLPKLNRKCKAIRNILVIALCLFCMMWLQGFPVQSYEALLKRAAGNYLIEEPMDLLYADEKEMVLYAAPEDKTLFKVWYEEKLFGMQLSAVRMFPADRILIEYDTVRYEEETDTYPLCFSGYMIGHLEETAYAELDVLIRFFTPIINEEETREIVTIKGTREGPYCLRFSTMEDGRDGEYTIPMLAALRMYDEQGVLLEESIYELPEEWKENMK